MYKYNELKWALNSSPTEHRFGKLHHLGSTATEFMSYSVIWCADIGISFRRKIRVEGGSSSTENIFLSNSNDAPHTFESVNQFLQKKPGHFVKIQCGGSSCLYMLIKLPIADASASNDAISWNALRFLHTIRWVPTTDSDVVCFQGVPKFVRPTLVEWVGDTDRIASIDAMPPFGVHWVWFRKPGYKLTQEIIERATSWIAINPGCKFHLWTDIDSAADVDDFLSNIKPDWRERFLAATTVHLRDDTYGVIESTLVKLTTPATAEGIAALRGELESSDRQARVFKTDFARLFILYVYGGVYVDFNDCLCLSPVRDLIAVYGAEKPIGVTDLYDLNHASNYFMYCPRESPEWCAIMLDIVRDVKYIVRLIRDPEMAVAMKAAVRQALVSCAQAVHAVQDVSALSTTYNRQVLPHIGNESMSNEMFERLIFIVLTDCANGSPEVRAAIDARLTFLKRPARARKGARVPEYRALTADEIALASAGIDAQFDALWLFWWTDYNLRPLMHFTNLPIYCRMTKTPLALAPFGYYFSYCCALSWMGHIGDGTSYGMDGRKDVHVANIYRVTEA
jgi:hypothetical protein